MSLRRTFIAALTGASPSCLRSSRPAAGGEASERGRDGRCDHGGSLSRGRLRGGLDDRGGRLVHRRSLTTAAAELFGEESPGVVVTVGISGTGGGFERFCAGETDISDASRPIKDEEAALCDEAGIDYIEIPVADRRADGRRQPARTTGHSA